MTNLENLIPRSGKTRCATVREIPNIPGYEWTTESFLRHAIFNAADRVGSGGAVLPGNGFSKAIIRIGRKVLIDLDQFDAWVESQRVKGDRR